MTPEQEREKIVDRLQKLKRHADSARETGSEKEAHLFAMKIEELMLKHKISMSEVEYEEDKKENPVGETWCHFRDPPRRKRCAWVEALCSIVTRAHNCQFMVVPSSSAIVIVGRKDNREAAIFTLKELVPLAEFIAQKEYDKFYTKMYNDGTVDLARGYKASFLGGFTSRLSQRYRELFAETKKAATPSQSKALIRLDTEKAEVKEYMKEQGCGRADGIGYTSNYNPTGYRDGKRAADNLNIGGKRVEG